MESTTAWTEITRPQYVRESLWYAGGLTDANSKLIAPTTPPVAADRPSVHDRLACGRQCDPVGDGHALSVAAIAERIPNLFDRPGLFL
jgi:hypothetical protein